jgi:protein O-GlcNAc transferase
MSSGSGSRRKTPKNTSPFVPRADCRAGRALSLVADLLTRGMAHHRMGRQTQAEAFYRKVLEIEPSNADALQLLGLIAYQLGKHSTALSLFDHALAANPRHVIAANSRGLALQALGRHKEAADSFALAIRFRPGYAEAHTNLGISLHVLGQYEAAVASYGKAIESRADFAEAYNNRGNSLRLLGRYEQARRDFERAIELNPKCAESYSNRGNLLQNLGRYEQAVEDYTRALALRPAFVEALCYRGIALNHLHQPDAALASINRALDFEPGSIDALISRGVIRSEAGLYPQALEDFDRVRALCPASAVLHYHRAACLRKLQRQDEAVKDYARAIAIDPDFRNLFGEYLAAKLHVCGWTDLSCERSALAARITQGKAAVLPLHLLVIKDSPSLQKKAAEIYVRDNWPASGAAGRPPRWSRHGKIRIGYFSPDFREHAIGWLTAELFERHDRKQFETYGFYLGPPSGDAQQRRIGAAMDEFLDVHELGDEQIVQLAREREIDIAVDLAGFTTHARTGIFARRAAPVQVNYLGYPGTMGAGFMDYLIADPTLISESSRQHYTEKIVYLPESYQVNDSTRPHWAACRTRAEEGLPENGFIYCCFNKHYKIAPETFALWMRILSRTEGSVLWLLADNSWARENLRQAAAGHGIAPERILFAGRCSHEEHMARHALADLFLDTLPYNAHTTASDALWNGLPLLTCMGKSFASRVAASLLRAVNLPEMIAPSLDAYEEMAVDLAQTPGRLAALKTRLRGNLAAAPLFDTPRFTRQLESAYRQIYERHHAGLAPDHIVVEEIAI